MINEPSHITNKRKNALNRIETFEMKEKKKQSHFFSSETEKNLPIGGQQIGPGTYNQSAAQDTIKNRKDFKIKVPVN